MRNKLSFGLLAAVAATAGQLVSCGGGGGGGSGGGGFQLTSISVADGQTWAINQRIDLVFNAPVDLSTVIAGSTVQLRSIDGSGASAFYDIGYLVDPFTGAVDKTHLVLQPFCPLLGDLSDAGLEPGGIEYELFIPGKTSLTPFTIKSLQGLPLELSQTRTFFTPTSTAPAAVFDDTAIGPPAFIPEGTLVRLGDGSEVPFVFNGTAHELTVELPLNLYSDASTSVEFLVQLNQAVDPSDENLNDDRVRIEFLDGTGQFQPFNTRVELESNCALDAPGAILRLTPEGILPQATTLRIVLIAGFTDLVGETNLSDQVDFFSATSAIDFASLTPADRGADEVFEDFVVSGEESGSLEDKAAAFDTPPAVWGGGALTAAFDFSGTGGPAGTFDWHTPTSGDPLSPVIISFSTDFAQITGGPDGIPSQTIPVTGGIIDVNDLYVRPGTYLRAQGSNPLTIIATGDVRIGGVIDLSGFDAKQVGTLFTAWLPEPGAAGACGGGSGGTGSPLTTASDPRGGPGNGPFGLPGAGAQGGETGWDTTTSKDLRRGAGGGGGRFGPDFDDGNEEMAAENGDNGHPQGQGAEHFGTDIAHGGAAGVGPFVDDDDDNDFWGKKGVYDAGGILTGLIAGELVTPWAGYGGGAGGDALNSTFPTVPFVPPAPEDKKGAGAGGGGGQLRIIALGRIIFEPGGQIICNGGEGATGENVLGFDHVAGSSGGGSGGHVILESATQVDFSNGGTAAGPEEFIQARGAIGGIQAGPSQDWSGGGMGGPGVIQIHVPNANEETAVGLDETFDIRIPPDSQLADLTKPTAHVLIPSFGARSKGRSRWIPLGEAALAPAGGKDAVFFAFDGTDPDPLSLTAGQVETTGDDVDPLAPLLGPEALGSAAPAPFVDEDGFTLVLSEPSIAPLQTDPGTPSADMYLRNPALLKNFALRLESGSESEDFVVSSGAYDDVGEVLRITVDAAGASLESFVAAAGGPAAVDYSLIPRFFRVRTGLFPDQIPTTGYVKVLFQATGTGADGLPDETAPVVDWTPDIAEFNTAGPGEIDFFRFEVEFNLDAAGAGLTVDTVPISVEFLRVPFTF